MDPLHLCHSPWIVDKIEKQHPITARVRHQDEKTGSEKIKMVGYTVMKPSEDDTFDSMLVGYKMELNTDEVGT
ncbi:hypothetical protein Tco_0673801 [Tanacetum coccineum]